MRKSIAIKLLLTILVFSFSNSCEATERITKATRFSDCKKFLSDDLKKTCIKAEKIEHSITTFSKLEKDVYGFSSEGSYLEFYKKNNDAKKFGIDHYGETGKRSLEYYYKNNKPILLIEEVVIYDKPIYESNFKEKDKSTFYCFFYNGMIDKCLEKQKIWKEKPMSNIEKEALTKDLDRYIKEIQ